jgi:hypothetical protein
MASTAAAASYRKQFKLAEQMRAEFGQKDFHKFLHETKISRFSQKNFKIANKDQKVFS